MVGVFYLDKAEATYLVVTIFVPHPDVLSWGWEVYGGGSHSVGGQATVVILGDL